MIETQEVVPRVEAPANLRPKKLTVWRRLLRRAAKPFAMALLAGGLSVSLVVTTPSNAQAFVPAPVLPAVWGATTMAIPSLMPTAAILGPVGWGAIAVAAVGVGLYATKDYWLPYVTGAFGQGNQNTAIDSPTAYAETVEVVESTKFGNDVTAKFAYLKSGVTTGYTLITQVIFKCQRNSDGLIAYKLTTQSQIQSTRNESWVKVFAYTGCPTTHTTKGWIVGGGHAPNGETYRPNIDGTVNGVYFSGNTSSAAGSHGPSNILRYGEMVDSGFDPRGADVTYRSVAECISPDGKYSTVEAFSKGDEGGLKMASCEAAGKGHGTGLITVWATPPGTTEETKLWETQRATEDPAQPLCSPGRPTSGCKLGVSLDGKPCVMGNVECENWSDLRNDPNHSTRLSCQYGPYQVSMETCNPLERAYEPGGAPATEPNTDGNPGTRDDTQPDGNTQPKPSTDPNAPPGAAAMPITGTNPSNNPGEEGQNCLGTGWSWNPVSWVMVPVQCAMQWAFVPPRAKLDTALQSIRPRLEARGITPFVTPVLSGVSGLGGSGCSGPPIDLSAVHLPTFYPFSACEAPMSHIATGVSAFFGLAIIIQGGMSCIRGVAAAFGFNWGLGSKTEEAA